VSKENIMKGELRGTEEEAVQTYLKTLFWCCVKLLYIAQFKHIFLILGA
jgi:hypothetical protein